MSHEFKNDMRFITRGMAEKLGVPRSDVNKEWCLSVKQPLASLLIDGVEPGITKSGPPPHELMGRFLTIHAGGGDLTLKSFTHATERRAELHFGRPVKELRAGFIGDNPLVHGALLGKARLIAAFKIGSVINGRIYAASRERGRMGVADDFDGVQAVPGDASAKRWLWVFNDPVKLSAPVPMKGAGGIFDLARWQSHLAAKEAQALAHEQMAADALSRGYSS